MCHVFIRGILGLIWLGAAIISDISGSFEMAALYVMLGSAFVYSAYAAWKKEKDGKGAGKMKTSILEIKNLSAWYNVGTERRLCQLLIPGALKRTKSGNTAGKMVLSALSLELAELLRKIQGNAWRLLQKCPSIGIISSTQSVGNGMRGKFDGAKSGKDRNQNAGFRKRKSLMLAGLGILCLLAGCARKEPGQVGYGVEALEETPSAETGGENMPSADPQQEGSPAGGAEQTPLF